MEAVIKHTNLLVHAWNDKRPMYIDYSDIIGHSIESIVIAQYAVDTLPWKVSWRVTKDKIRCIIQHKNDLKRHMMRRQSAEGPVQTDATTM